MVENTRSVRSRLVGWLLLPLACAVGLGTALDYQLSARSVRRSFDEALGQSALALAARVEPGREDHPGVRVADEGANFPTVQGTDLRHFAVITADGRLIGGDTRLPLRSASSDPPLMFRDIEAEGERLREAIHRSSVAGDVVIVAVASTTHTRDATVRSILLATLGGSLAELAIVVAIVWLGVGAGLASLLRLRDQVAARTPGETDALPEHAAPAEARPLVRVINESLARARQAVAARQEFVADAAHQLRRPLTSVQAGLERLAQELGEAPQRPRADALLADSRRLARTAHQLLALAQADATPSEDAPRMPVPLDQLVAEAAERTFDAALERGIDLGVEREAVTIDGVPWLLGEALANLVDNALRYSPHGARVTLRSGSGDIGAFLEVEDDGPGIPPAQRQRVRERFQRGIAGDGSGLGLAIVERAATVHRAVFIIEAGGAGRGTRCRLDFPCGSGGKERNGR